MDVGDPSNFIRIQEIYKNEDALLKEHISSYSFTDDETKAAMKSIKKISGYIADPSWRCRLFRVEKIFQT